MKRFQTISTLFILAGLVVGCSENLTGPDETMMRRTTAQVIMKGEPRGTVIYVCGSPSVLLLTGYVENIGEATAYSVRVKYTQGCVCGNCGTSPLNLGAGESASFSMHVDLDPPAVGSRIYDITWYDNP
jgi:hypothetical protein